MTPPRGLTALHLRQGHPDFLDLSWHLPHVALRREQPALALLRSADAPLPAVEADARAEAAGVPAMDVPASPAK